MRRAKETPAFLQPHAAEPVAVPHRGLALFRARKRRGTLCSCSSACCSRTLPCSQNTKEAVLLQRGLVSALSLKRPHAAFMWV